MGCLYVIESCQNRSSRTRYTDNSIKFCIFQKTNPLGDKWISACHQNVNRIPKAYIYSDHFESTDFERGFEAETLNLLPKKVLKLQDELCGLCGSFNVGMKSIFDSSDFNFCEAIYQYCSNIKISRNGILFLLIRVGCENSLLAWYQFSTTCSTVNNKFQRIVKDLRLFYKIGKYYKSFSPNENQLKFLGVKKEMYHVNDTDGTDLSDDSNIKEIEIVEVSPDAIELNSSEIVPLIEKCDPDKFMKYLMVESITANDTESEISNDVDNKVKIESIVLPMVKDVTSARRKRRARLASLNLKRMCHICGKIFKYPESLRRHLKTVHSDERPFKCNLCTSSFNRNHNLTIHIKVVHQRQRLYVKKNIPRLCDYCGKVLLSVRSLEEHISSIHTKKALYECDRCHTTFFRKLSFDKHKMLNECDSQNPKNSDSKCKREFLKYCEFCGLEFKKEHFYIKHKFKHMDTFTCSVCSLKFEDGSLLKEHTDMDHPELKPFECEVCHKKFKSKSLLNCHLVIHSGEKRYQCEICSLKFLKKKYLTTHILTHTGERPFVCSICLKGFKQSGDMRKHKATHLRARKICD